MARAKKQEKTREEKLQASVTNIAAAMVRADATTFPGVDITQEELQYAKLPSAPFQTAKDIPEDFYYFADNMYLEVTCVPQHNHYKNLGEGLSIPKEVMREINGFFSLNTPIKTVLNRRSMVDGKRIKMLADCKTQNLPLAEVFAIAQKLRQGITLPSGAFVQLFNLDVTRNFPGYIQPVSTEDLDILEESPDGKYPELTPWKNKHFVGLSCNIWKHEETVDRQQNRYDYQDEDTNEIKLAGVSAQEEWKIYDKFIFHLEVTGARGEAGGNSLEHIFYSDHNNINQAHRHPLVHLHGFGRGELRLGASRLPETLEEVIALWDFRYNQTVVDCVASMPLNEEWLKWLPKDASTLFLAVEQPDNTWEWAHIRWFNRNTGNFNCVSSSNTKIVAHDKEEVAQIAYATAVKGIPCVFRLVDKHQHITEILPDVTEHLSQPKLTPPKADNKNSRSKVSTVTREEVGVPNFPFEPRRKPIPYSPEALIWAGLQWREVDPPLQTKREYNHEKKEWLKQVQSVANAELSKLLREAKVLREQTHENKSTKFSKLPVVALVVELKYNDYKNPCALVPGEKGGWFVCNSAIKYNKACNQKFSAIDSADPQNCLKVLIRGKQTGTYEGNPIFGDAVLVPLTLELVGKYDRFNKLVGLFLTEEHFEKYRHVKI